MKPTGLFLLTLMLALPLLAPVAAPPVSAQADQGRIAFVSDRDGNDEIYVMNADGSGVTRLTDNPASDTTPAWSPDGTKIAFSSDRDAQNGIYLMNADGTNITRLLTEISAFNLAWTPDGRRISFTGYAIPSDGESLVMAPLGSIYVMDADGSNLTGLLERTGVLEMRGYMGALAWSPDGTRIAFETSEWHAYQGVPDVYLGNADGSNIIRVTTDGGASPAWSPDSSRIAFSTAWDWRGMQSSIYTMNADGTNRVQLTQLPHTSEPSWSPAGSHIAFSSYDPATNATSIYTMQANGSDLVRLGDGYAPNWSRTAAPVTPPDALLFPETGYSIAGRIRSYWEQNGGLPVFGLPITVQQEEVIEGKPVQTQWFERNRLELHPENAAPYDVLLGRLGADRLAQRGYDWQSVPPEAPQEGCRFFAETGRNVCGDILAAWRANGLELDGRTGFSESENLALFGLPITGLINEQASDGGEFQVQYFERARFELHPENAPPYNVLLGLLGNEVRGGN